MSLRSLHHLLAPERVLFVGPAGTAAGWAAAAEANLFGLGFTGELGSLATTGAAPAEARLRSPRMCDGRPFLALVCLPQAAVESLMDGLFEHGCRAVVLLGGSAPGDIEPTTLARLRVSARARDVRLIGPDRVGVVVPRLGLSAGVMAELPPAGQTAFITQSDTLATSLVEWAATRGVGFSSIVSLGGSADQELGDVLDYLALEPETRTILLHLDGLADARRFMSAARSAASVKPIIALKSSRDRGPGALDVDAVFDAAFARAGILRVDTIDSLVRAAYGLAACSGPGAHSVRGGRLAIIANGGGPAHLAVDRLRRGRGIVAPLSAGAGERLAQALGWPAAAANPVELGLEADGAAYAAALDVLGREPEVDGILVLHGPAPGIAADEVAAAVATTQAALRRTTGWRPVIAAWQGGETLRLGRRELQMASVPTFATPEAAVEGFLYRVQHERRQALLRRIPALDGEDAPPDRNAVGRIIETALAAGRPDLTEPEALGVLTAYHIPCAATRLAADADEAARAAAAIGYPVALKALCEGVAQKRGIGGVALDIETEQSLRVRAAEMVRRVTSLTGVAACRGFIVQKLERGLDPLELRLGMELDPVFGPVLLFGQGGAAAILATEPALALPPLDVDLARAMLESLPLGRALLRDDGPCDAEALLRLMVRLSRLVVEQPTFTRIEIDPVLSLGERLVALDAHIRVERVPPGAEAAARLAIRPYPVELEQEVRLESGRTVRLRPIRPSDAAALRAGFAYMTPEDLRRRLFMRPRTLSDELAARMTQIDYDREMALVVPDPDQPGLLWAGARIAAEPDGRRAEYAVTVRSDKQRLGLGRLCLERILDYARTRGIEEVWGTVLRENAAMLGLVRSLGFAITADSDDPELVKVTLRLG